MLTIAASTSVGLSAYRSIRTGHGCGNRTEPQPVGGPSLEFWDRRDLAKQGQQVGEVDGVSADQRGNASGVSCPSTRMGCLPPDRARLTVLGPLLGRAERPGHAEETRSPFVTSRAVSQPAATHVQAIPGAGLIPDSVLASARYARTNAQILRQVLPLNPGMQHEQDAAQCMAVSNFRLDGHPSPGTGNNGATMTTVHPR